MATMSAATSAAELQKRSPVAVRVMTRLLSAGFSTEVARHITEHLPVEATLAGCEQWLHEVLALNLRCAAEHDGITERGGVFALVGPTGVGKTTTVAKLAARFAVKYGAAQLGLVTLDAYRVGAHEQLRTYGRILGTPVHLAQDAVTLADVLAAMSHKRLVLIDTCGVSQRDERLGEMLAMLEQAGTPRRPVQRVLLLNAASHAETIEAVARAWRAREAGAAILTKLDEAVRIGGALDSVLRHKLVLMGATHGQRVPEDWLAADAAQLAALALQPGGTPFAFSDDEAALLATSQRAAAAQAFA
jgi:flagellar biosynthesis protein FlhF